MGKYISKKDVRHDVRHETSRLNKMELMVNMQNIAKTNRKSFVTR